MGNDGIFQLIWRGVRLRCPYCGKGRLYRRGYAMFERCPVCGWLYEREEGYWTGAMAVNLVGTELLLTAVAVPAALLGTPLPLLIALGVTLPILLPLLFYRVSKSLWMTIDFVLHPVGEGEQR